MYEVESRSFVSGFRICVVGGDDRIRTGDGGFADPCLTTWLRRPETACFLRTSPPGVDRAEAVEVTMLVPRRRFELLRPCEHRPLKTACLPIPPPRRGGAFQRLRIIVTGHRL